MTLVLVPDAEETAVTWARADPDIGALVAGRCATRLPKDWQTSFLRVVRVGGDPDRDDGAPIDLARLQWDAYARTRADTPGPDYTTASTLIRTVLARCRAATQIRIVTLGSWIYGFRVVAGPLRVPEPETGWARYRIETLMQFRTAT